MTLHNMAKANGESEFVLARDAVNLAISGEGVYCEHFWRDIFCCVLYMYSNVYFTVYSDMRPFTQSPYVSVCQVHCAMSYSLFDLKTCRVYSNMMTPSNGNIFRVTGPLWGESTGHKCSRRNWNKHLILLSWSIFRDSSHNPSGYFPLR